MNITLTLPDGSQKQFEAGVTGRQVAESIGAGLARAALGIKVDGELRDLDRPIAADAQVAIVTAGRDAPDADALYLLRHSCAHVMAEAIQRLYPGTKLAYGPPVENGFYYDIDCPSAITEEDFPRIEAEMERIIGEDRPFTRYEMSRAEAERKLAGDEYKLDNVARADGDVMSFYATGEPGRDWEDLCRGPHVPSTGRIGAFKLLSVAGAYWRGDASRQQLQRVYGTAFPDKKQLKAHLAALEEARKRDHRVLGRQLGLFHIDEAVGQGLVLWKPKGAVVRQELQNFISEELRRQGYHQVFTPHIGKLGLYRTSGHFPYYRESQYPPIIEHDELARLADEGATCAELSNRMAAGTVDGYLLKPMNCPHHIRIFASEHRSYRDLPIRLAEFGTVYRWEQSGEIGGMTRVRGFTQDDAHIFCTEDQVTAELLGCLSLVRTVFQTLGMHDYRVRVGLRDPDSGKYVGAPENWDKAEAACRAAARSLGVAFSEEPGEAAFYGPKIDFVVKDVIGREWQLGTVQVDYNLPERFALEYIGADNSAHRPVMIHRAPFGSMERFVGVLIEHFAGAFPPWLAPVQAAVLAITDAQLDYAREVLEQLKEAGLRAEIDTSSEKIGKKIRAAELAKIPFMFVLGAKEAESRSVALRRHGKGDEGVLGLAEAVALLKAKVTERALA
ncbi:MAG: Threonine--tRNA ligase [candidate division BRC1 bacterium ADurb.BinA292]|nr:MAG: Threonine--tRNA ligase [candidate division BRC1 bacterium ADurb.BinA292]